MDSGDASMIPVFINDRLVSVEPGVAAAVAVAAANAEWGSALAEGRAYVTDGRGIRLDPASPLTAGAILRVIVSARQSAPEADAQS